MKLSDLMKKHFGGAEADAHASTDLPTACPLLGNPVPRACLFEKRFFRRMDDQGVLPVGGTCPLLGVCGLVCSWPNTSHERNNE